MVTLPGDLFTRGLGNFLLHLHRDLFTLFFGYVVTAFVVTVSCETIISFVRRDKIRVLLLFFSFNSPTTLERVNGEMVDLFNSIVELNAPI